MSVEEPSGRRRTTAEDVDAIPVDMGDGEMTLFLERDRTVEEVSRDDPVGIVTDYITDLNGEPIEYVDTESDGDDGE